MSGFFRLEVIEKPFNPRTIRTDQDARFTIQPFRAENGTRRVIQRCLFFMKQNILAMPAFDEPANRRERLRFWGRDHRFGGLFQTFGYFHGYCVFGQNQVNGDPSVTVPCQGTRQRELTLTRRDQHQESFAAPGVVETARHLRSVLVANQTPEIRRSGNIRLHCPDGKFAIQKL